MRFSRIFGFTCAFLTGVSLNLRAVEVVLTPQIDTSLFQPTPDNNLGLSSLASGTTSSFPMKTRALIKFDVTNAIPANATISSATLTLNVVKTPGDGGEPSTFDVFRMLRSWIEGDKGGNTGEPATAGQPTWNSRAHLSSGWGTPGGSAGFDYVNTSSASQAINDVGSYSFSSANLIADVDLWKNAGTNFGWILISRSEALFGTARRFGSKEDAVNTPTLTIEYTVPTVTGPIITNLAKAGNQFQFTFNAAANTTYSVETNSAVSATGWAVYTNFSASGTPITRTVTNAINSTARYYRVKTP